MRADIIIGIVFACQISSVRAEDYKDATDAAYCVGVYQSDLEEWKSMNGAQSQLAQIRDLEQKNFRKQAFVEGAIKQGKIDLVTASKMRSVGFYDANLCSQNTWKCIKEWNERKEKNIGDELNHRQLANCNKDTEPVCERAYKNCE